MSSAKIVIRKETEKWTKVILTRDRYKKMYEDIKKQPVKGNGKRKGYELKILVYEQSKWWDYYRRDCKMKKWN